MQISEHVKNYHQGIRHPCPIEGCDADFGLPRCLTRHIRDVHGRITPKKRVKGTRSARSRAGSVTSTQTLESVPQRDLPEFRAPAADQTQFEYPLAPYNDLGQHGSSVQGGGVTGHLQSQFNHHPNSYQAALDVTHQAQFMNQYPAQHGSSAQGTLTDATDTDLSQFYSHADLYQDPVSGPSLAELEVGVADLSLYDRHTRAPQVLAHGGWPVAADPNDLSSASSVRGWGSETLDVPRRW